MSLHPVVRLLAWGVTAVMAQLASGLPLACLFTVLVASSAALSLQRFWRLVRRTRWLLLALALLFAWGTPGVLLFPEFGEFSPSREGVVLAATHAARLLAVLASLALLLRFTPAEDFVGALHSLMRPLEGLGVDRGRIAVRLLLVIEYVESAQARSWREWLAPGAAGVERERVALTRVAFSARDGVALGLAFACAAAFAVVA